MGARDEQVGGSHYVRHDIQIRDIAIEYGLEYEEVLALRYLLRWRDKAGLEDLQKCKHCIDLLIEREFPAISKLDRMGHPAADTLTDMREKYCFGGHPGKPGC